MPSPVRITIALDDDTVKLFEDMKRKTNLSQSELVRRALRFYSDNREVISSSKNLVAYMDMLPSGEHVILDMDHWFLFLKLIETSPDATEFWDKCKNVADSHAEQLSNRVSSLKELLERLEVCNFFKLIVSSNEEYTLMLSTDITKEWVKRLVQDFSVSMGFNIEVKEDISKLRVKVVGS